MVSSNSSYTYDFFVTRIKYAMYNIQDYSVIYNNAAHLVICEGRVYKTNLILPLFIEVPASSLESERSCICVLEVSILSLFL